jgi:FMN phosphatase YigB (HAD superfamily)
MATKREGKTMDLSRIRCVIFDFADTLCSVPYFAPLGQEFCEVVTEAIFSGENKARWATPWTSGILSSEDICIYLSGLTGITPKRIFTALEEGCSNLNLNPAIWQFAQSQRKQGRQTVLATINMDIFTSIVVPTHKFDKVFDVVVNSADYGVDTKIELCEIAFSHLNCCSFENTLLIDDSSKSIESYKARGGMAYQYTTDEAFVEFTQNPTLTPPSTVSTVPVTKSAAGEQR